MKSKCVLFIGTTSNYGGAPKSLISMIYTLKINFGIMPIVITPLKNGNLHRFCNENNICCYIIPYCDCTVSKETNYIKRIKNFILLPYRKVKLFVKNQLALMRIKKILKKYPVDIIHSNVNRNTLGCLISKKYHIPHVLHIREFGQDDYKLEWLKKDIFKYFNKYCDAFVCISEAVRKYWVEKGLNFSKTKVVYNGFNVKNLNNSNNKISYNDGIKAIFMGTIIPSKGQFQVLKAIYQLPEKIKKNFCVDFYGKISDPKYFESLSNYVEKYKLDNNVKFFEYIDDIETKLKEYNLAFMCSKSEGFGRVTVEYMLNNVPVIASDRGANIEIIRHKVNGFLYEYNNIHDLKDKILEAINCKNINEIVNNARECAIECYSAEKNASEILKLYNLLLDNDNKE